MATNHSPYNLQVTGGLQLCREQKAGFFAGLGKQIVDKMEAVAFSSSYPQNSVLFVEGQSPRVVMVLTQGRVKLTVSSAEGKTLIVKIASAGELLGLSSCLLNQPLKVSAETITPCQVSSIKVQDFMRLMAEADLCLRAAEYLSLEYHEACRELSMLGLSHSAELKLASLLLDMTSQGASSTGQPTCKLTMTHEGISQMLGTSRETVTRVLARLRRAGIIAISGSTLVVRNLNALRNIAQGIDVPRPSEVREERRTKAVSLPQSRLHANARLAYAAV